MNSDPNAAATSLLQFKPARPTIDDYAKQLAAAGKVTPAVEESIKKARAIQSEHDVVFYIAGALTGMSDEVKQRYADLSGLIATYTRPGARMFGYAPHLHGTDPVKHPDVTPEEVRDIDYLWAVVMPDGQLNFWDPMGHGNAIEAGWAEEHGVPVVSLVSDGVHTSRLVRGLNNLVETITYKDFKSGGMEKVKALLDAIEAQKPSA
jgi:hypothetical protein